MATALSSRSSSWISSSNNSPPHSLTHTKYGTVTGSQSNGRSIRGLFESTEAHKRSSTQHFGAEASGGAERGTGEGHLSGLGLVREAWSVTAAEYKKAQGDEDTQTRVSDECSGWRMCRQGRLEIVWLTGSSDADGGVSFRSGNHKNQS